jgi:hypothetical protein
VIRHGHLGKVVREEKKEAHEAKKEEKELKKEKKGAEKPVKTGAAATTDSVPTATGKGK